MSAYKKKYHPINCSFHDILLENATFGKNIAIIYNEVEGTRKESNNIIKDVYTKNSEEFMLLDDGKIIRLDHIVSVDGVLLPETSCNISKD
jgi:Rho-binding antiterminator